MQESWSNDLASTLAERHLFSPQLQRSYLPQAAMTTTDYPRRLYKYFAPERASALDSAMLRYTPQGGFNDPFEGRPEITKLSTDQQVLETFDEIFPEEAKRMYEQLPVPAKALLPFAQFMALMSQFAEAKKPELLLELRKLTPLAKSWFHQKFDEHIGALCLSEVPDSLLMWSHYAASHTGFAIEFDGHHPHFHERKTDQDEFRHLRRVLYRDAVRCNGMECGSAIATKQVAIRSQLGFDTGNFNGVTAGNGVLYGDSIQGTDNAALAFDGAFEFRQKTGNISGTSQVSECCITRSAHFGCIAAGNCIAHCHCIQGNKTAVSLFIGSHKSLLV